MAFIIKSVICFGLLCVVAIGAACQASPTKPAPKLKTKKMSQLETLVVAGGCFWCVEVIYEELRGVEKVESGYTGGHVLNPTYQQICTGTTGHAEAVRITFDPKVISQADLLRIFFTTHDPTTLNRQGPDSGTQYRSAIFYASEAQKKLAEQIIAEVTKEKIWNDKIVTSLEPLQKFYVAEQYHQDYYSKFEKADDQVRSGMNAGYCRAIIEPKVRKFRQKYADKLKTSG